MLDVAVTDDVDAHWENKTDFFGSVLKVVGKSYVRSKEKKTFVLTQLNDVVKPVFRLW